MQHDLLELVVCAQSFVPLRRAFNLWDELSHGGLVRAVSVLLNAPVAEVNEALSSRGRLLRCGLLSITLHGGDTLHRMLNVPEYLRRTLAYYEGDAFHTAQDTGGTDRGAASMANHRASMNRLMEDTQLPVVWIMNHPQVLDPAVLRRFDAVVHFKPLARSVRRHLLTQRLGDLVPAQEIERWADIAELTPALIDRLSHVWTRSQARDEQREGVGAEGHRSTAMDLQGARHWLRERLPGKSTRHLPKATGQQSSGDAGNGEPRIAWSPTQVHASADLLQIAAGMQASGGGRVLLYGPPGTGKTAYARHLARVLDMSLQQWRASYLLSPWVGGTEQRIAEVFEEAYNEEALLFIDEADSLVYRRSDATRSWEVSQVNELLQHLEEFQGCLVLATNRLDALDPAVLRRMDVKVQFHALEPAQVVEAFKALCERCHIPHILTDHDLRILEGLREVTPGDFACVVRRAGLVLQSGANVQPAAMGQLLAMLMEEVDAKNGGRTSIGFLGPTGKTRQVRDAQTGQGS